MLSLSVSILCDPADYTDFIHQLKSGGVGGIQADLRKTLAVKVGPRSAPTATFELIDRFSSHIRHSR